MLRQRTAAFSPDNKYFTCFNDDDRLLVWETSDAAAAVIDYKLDSSVYGSCTSLHWISDTKNDPSPKKAKLTRSQSQKINDQLLAVGTAKGDVLLYNVTVKNLYSHLVSRHSDSVNDMCFYRETDSFFTCSSDKSIAIWNISSGKQKSRWIADDAPVSKLCVLDQNNLLSASKSILWWNISEKSIIKKFCGHTSEIFKLLPVNSAMSLNSCYFLSTAVSDSKINAWSLSANDCQIPVASFISLEQPEDMDISRVSSKDKPLILSVVTKEGNFNLFKHTLNGNVNQPLYPKTTLKITPEANSCESKTAFIISVKLSDDSESCVIAYGSNKDNVMFKHIRIKESLKDHPVENVMVNNISPEDCKLSVKESMKIENNLLINGLKSLESSPITARLKDTSLVTKNSQKKKTSSVHNTSASSLQVSETTVKKHIQRDAKSKRHIRDTDIADPDSSVGTLLKGLQTQNRDLIDAIFYNSDAELISECVKSLPSHALRCALEELGSRLKQNLKSSHTLGKWLKEILRVHLSSLIKCQDTIEIVGCMKELVEAKRVCKTSSKLSVLKGLLSLPIQNASSDESDSDSETSMES